MCKCVCVDTEKIMQRYIIKPLPLRLLRTCNYFISFNTRADIHRWLDKFNGFGAYYTAVHKKKIVEKSYVTWSFLQINQLKLYVSRRQERKVDFMAFNTLFQ